MRISELIDQLAMFPPDWEVHIRTNPDDLTQPLRRRLISVCQTMDTRGGQNRMEQPILVLTAFIKHEQQPAADRGK